MKCPLRNIFRATGTDANAITDDLIFQVVLISTYNKNFHVLIRMANSCVWSLYIIYIIVTRSLCAASAGSGEVGKRIIANRIKNPFRSGRNTV